MINGTISINENWFVNKNWLQFGVINGKMLYLCPINEYKNIPIGIKLTNIFGYTHTRSSILKLDDKIYSWSDKFLVWGILVPYQKYRSIDDKWD